MVSARMPEPKPGMIKFPPRPDADKPLVLPRRRLRSASEVSQAAAETQKTLSAIRSATRNPWGEILNADTGKVVELERSLKQLSAKLEERERSLQDFETRLAERERDLAETETLLRARESLLEAKSKAPPSSEPRQFTDAEQAALEKLKAEVERQQALLAEQRQALRERESFLDESETKLFQKVQEQQEKETELEQKEEDLRRRERKLREREALHDPRVAAELEAEKAAAKKYDEFNE